MTEQLWTPIISDIAVQDSLDIVDDRPWINKLNLRVITIEGRQSGGEEMRAHGTGGTDSFPPGTDTARVPDGT